MAPIEVQTAASKTTKRKLHAAPRIDMTPMVDLGFLLISFFIFTTTMSEKTSMKLYMPHDGDPSTVAKSKVLTVLLGNNNKVYAYEGAFDEALKKNQVLATGYGEGDGIGNLIRRKQQQLFVAGKKDDLVFLIKPTNRATYKNIIDALDETTINGVKKYMVLDASAEETQLLKEPFFR